MILATPLSSRLLLNCLIWHYDSKGFFSVKSAYKVAVSMRDVASSSGQSFLITETWNKLWKASVPGKVKIYAWKACRNILPTRLNLENKGVAVNNICIFCRFSSKSVLHVFYDYPFCSSSVFFFLPHGYAPEPLVRSIFFGLVLQGYQFHFSFPV